MLQASVVRLLRQGKRREMLDSLDVQAQRFTNGFGPVTFRDRYSHFLARIESCSAMNSYACYFPINYLSLWGSQLVHLRAGIQKPEKPLYLGRMPLQISKH